MSLRIFGRFLQATGPLARIPSLQYSVCIRTGRHYSTKLKEEPGIKDDSEQFSGYIPPEKLCIRYCRSSGPGGQHVNKTNSKVEIRFHVESADWIPDSLKEKLIEREKTRITNSGYLIVTSEKTRKQILNQADCIDKIRQMVFLAAKKPRELTPEEIQEIEARKARAKRRILREKRIHSLKKYNRTMGCVNVE